MVGTWNTTAPDKDKSVSKNKPILQNNTDYIKNNLNLDHYWDDSSTTDGYHRQVSAVKKSADPTSLLGGTDGMFYVRDKTATESPDSELPTPYFYHTPDGGTTNYYQQLGFRALVLCTDCSTGTPAQADVPYFHNINTQAAGTPGFVRTSAGNYTITFAQSLPSDNYLVIATCENNNNSRGYIATVEKSGKTSADCDIRVRTDEGSLADPASLSIAIIGG